MYALDTLKQIQNINQQNNGLYSQGLYGNDYALGTSLGGLIGSMIAKRNDGKNDSLGNGFRYTNDSTNGGAFNDKQIAALKSFANNNMDTSKNYNALANQKFTINNQQFQADKNGLLTPLFTQDSSNTQTGLGAEIPKGAASIGLEKNKLLDL